MKLAFHRMKCIVSFVIVQWKQLPWVCGSVRLWLVECRSAIPSCRNVTKGRFRWSWVRRDVGDAGRWRTSNYRIRVQVQTGVWSAGLCIAVITYLLTTIFRFTLRQCRPNKAGLKYPSVRACVRPSIHKKFLRFQWNLAYR